MKAAILQIASIGLSPNRLDYYLRICKSKDVKLLLLGEYVMNRFFLELKKTPLSMLENQYKVQSAFLKELATKFDIALVVPLVKIVGKKPYKIVGVFKPQSTLYYTQQLLINYPHWNEERFFANEAKEPTAFTFRVEGVKFGLLSGFEAHFDPLWIELDKKDIDALLLPSIGTFSSQRRWEELAKMRSFTHNCYLLRANRIGSFEDWEFYGDSFAISPEGEILARLGADEELLIVELDRQRVKEAKKLWGFSKRLKKRGWI